MRGGEFFANDLFDYSGGFEDGIPLLERAHQKVPRWLKDLSPNFLKRFRKIYVAIFKGSVVPMLDVSASEELDI